MGLAGPLLLSTDGRTSLPLALDKGTVLKPEGWNDPPLNFVSMYLRLDCRQPDALSTPFTLIGPFPQNTLYRIIRDNA